MGNGPIGHPSRSAGRRVVEWEWVGMEEWGTAGNGSSSSPFPSSLSLGKASAAAPEDDEGRGTKQKGEKGMMKGKAKQDGHIV
jgi:hypothetical protein